MTSVTHRHLGDAGVLHYSSPCFYLQQFVLPKWATFSVCSSSKEGCLKNICPGSTILSVNLQVPVEYVKIHMDSHLKQCIPHAVRVGSSLVLHFTVSRNILLKICILWAVILRRAGSWILVEIHLLYLDWAIAFLILEYMYSLFPSRLFSQLGCVLKSSSDWYRFYIMQKCGVQPVLLLGCWT